jgi:hypothetical protein
MQVRLRHFGVPKRMLVLGTVTALAMVGLSPVASALAAPTLRVDLRVLVVENGTPSANAIAAELGREGVPYTTVDLASATRPTIDQAFLETVSPTVLEGNFQAVVLPDAAPAGMSAAELLAVTTYEATFGVRQISAYVWPGSVGLDAPVYSGSLDGRTATVTAAGLAGPFSYLSGSFAFDDFDPSVMETYGYVSTVPAAAAATVQSLVTVTDPGGSAVGTAVGVSTDQGRENMFLTVGYNENQQWFQDIAHGLITWVTRGVHLGYDRNYFSVQVDDVFLADGRWSSAANCTPGEDCTDPTVTTPDIRMVPSDVTRLTTWQVNNGYRLDLVFNSGGTDQFKAANGGTDPMATALLAAQNQFHWTNHTYSHPFLGCRQDFTSIPWGCLSTIPGQLRVAAGDMNTADYQWFPATGDPDDGGIIPQIEQNQQFAATNNLTNFDPTELVTGEHSGLLTNPQQPMDNPNLAPSLLAAGIHYTASDASRETGQRLVAGSTTTLTVPRHPTNIYYNVGTYQDEVSEYNWIYTSRANGGSGTCEDHPETTTCITPLDASTEAAATASFNSYILPLETRIALSHVLTNDPRSHYAHQSNLSEDAILLPMVSSVLSSYRSLFAANAPIVEQTLTQQGQTLGLTDAWNTASGGVTAYLDGLGLHLGASSAAIPLTVPTATTGTAVAGLSAYAGEKSGWLTGQTGLVANPGNVGYNIAPITIPGAPTAVTGIAGDASVNLSWTAPAVDGGSPLTGYVITPFKGATAQAPITVATPVTALNLGSLTNGTAYTFTVAATNAAGTGAASAPSAALTPAAPSLPPVVTVPGAPTSLVAKTSSSSATLTWKAPTTTGGSPITGYLVTTTVGTTTKSTLITSPTATTITLSGLTNGSLYTFGVAAVNAIGTGPAATATGTPNAPSVQITPLSASVSPVTLSSSVKYSWVGTPSGSPIVRYNVSVKRASFGTAFPAAWTSIGSTTQSTTTVTLSAGQSVQIAVQAVDAAGNVSALSAPSSVTTLPLTASSMKASTGWTTAFGFGYYGFSAHVDTKSAATLTLPSATAATRVAVVGTAASGYGTVDVYVGSVKVGTLNFAAATTTQARTLVLGPFAAVSGVVSLRVPANDKTVRIQGAAVLP